MLLQQRHNELRNIARQDPPAGGPTPTWTRCARPESRSCRQPIK